MSSILSEIADELEAVGEFSSITIDEEKNAVIAEVHPRYEDTIAIVEEAAHDIVPKYPITLTEKNISNQSSVGTDMQGNQVLSGIRLIFELE